MNILIPDSWLRGYLQTDASAQQIKDCLSLCGPSVEKIIKSGDDSVYEIEITSNRIDTVSVYGIAREAAAILPRFGIPATLKKLEVKDPAIPSNTLPMNITDPEKNCNRILGIVLEVTPMKPSPAYIKERLEKCGVRSLNNLVDITNYVMLEIGHPCHVFDYDRIKTHTFILRKAKKNEPIITLDEKKYLLNEEDVIIDDGTGRVIDLPGIMGTENSVVTPQTKRILFFIESNNPILIRRTSKRYGIRTMAAAINEKHPDPTLSKTAMLYGVGLYEKLAGGKVESSLIDIYPHKTTPKEIVVSVDFINKRLGINLKPKEIIEILRSLSFEVNPLGSDLKLPEGLTPTLTIIPPSFRQFDIEIPEDIVEEVARIYGYHNLPSRLMQGEIPISDKPKDLPVESQVKTALKYWGFTEIYNYSFISKNIIGKALLDIKKHLRVSNPLTEDIEFMRISLIPSMLSVVSANQHLTDHLNLFELSNVYLPRKNELPDELPLLLITGTNSFYEVKGIVEAIFEEFGIGDYEITEESSDFFHPKQTIQYLLKNKIMATVGKINPQLIDNFGIKKDVYAGEINMRLLVQNANPVKKYTPIPLYPAVVEDLTLNIDKNTKKGEVIAFISSLNKLIQKVELIDAYKDSMTLRITYQDKTKNLESENVKVVREHILNSLQKKFSIILKQ